MYTYKNRCYHYSTHMEHKSYKSAMRAFFCTRDSDMSVINNDARIIYVLHFLIQFNL